jgi:hypothetical protein
MYSINRIVDLQAEAASHIRRDTLLFLYFAYSGRFGVALPGVR